MDDVSPFVSGDAICQLFSNHAVSYHWIVEMGELQEIAVGCNPGALAAVRNGNPLCRYPGAASRHPGDVRDIPWLRLTPALAVTPVVVSFQQPGLRLTGAAGKLLFCGTVIISSLSIRVLLVYGVLIVADHKLEDAFCCCSLLDSYQPLGNEIRADPAVLFQHPDVYGNIRLNHSPLQCGFALLRAALQILCRYPQL